MGKIKLSDPQEVLLRNIHPSWIQDGVPTSMAFRPSPKDGKQLSVDQNSKVDAKSSFELHTEKKGLSSIAIFGVSIEECSAEQLPVLDDPILESEQEPANSAHALIDFSAHGTKPRERKAKVLKSAAIQRGVLYHQ